MPIAAHTQRSSSALIEYILAGRASADAAFFLLPLEDTAMALEDGLDTIAVDESSCSADLPDVNCSMEDGF